MDLGMRLKLMREKRGMSQLELANKLSLSQKTISSWEKNRTHPKLKELNRLCEIYDCTYEALTGTKQHDVNDITVNDILLRIDNLSSADIDIIISHAEASRERIVEIEKIKSEKEHLEMLLKQYDAKMRFLKGEDNDP